MIIFFLQIYWLFVFMIKAPFGSHIRFPFVRIDLDYVICKFLYPYTYTCNLFAIPPIFMWKSSMKVLFICIWVLSVSRLGLNVFFPFSKYVIQCHPDVNPKRTELHELFVQVLYLLFAC